MKPTFKIVYVLVSNNEDYYYEQLLLSATSLRKKMPNVEVFAMVDEETENYLNTRKNSWESLINQLIIVSVPNELSPKERSRWLKTSMRKHIEGDFLFIDCDTIIVEDLSDIANLDIDLGAVLDCHFNKKYLLNINKYKEMFRRTDELLNFHLSLPELNYFNSGVIFCRDTEQNHIFFDEWYKLWKLSSSAGIVTDQQSFYEANYNLNGVIKELDGKWNCTLWLSASINYLSSSHIIHCFKTGYFSENLYLLAEQSVFEEIRKNGITDKIEKMLDNPRAAFSENARIMNYPQITDKLDRNIDNLSLKTIFKIAIKRILGIFFEVSMVQCKFFKKKF